MPNAFLLEKLICELEYEINNQSEWVQDYFYCEWIFW